MDRRQTRFLIIVASLVILFIAVLALMDLTSRQTIPARTPPVEETYPTDRATTPAGKTPLPTQSRTATASPLAATPVPSNTVPQPSATPTPQTAYFVSPDGSPSNDGSKARPWSLQYVLDGPEEIQPGSTVWLLGGTYMGPFASNIDGREGAPVNIRAVPGERVTLTSDTLVIDIQESSYVNFWGIEITAVENLRDPIDRERSAYGVRVHQAKQSHNIKFINVIVHDMPAQGFGWWQANFDSEIYGSLIYYNGASHFDHGIYVHNTEGRKSIIDNFIYDNASHGIHAYGEKDYPELNNLYIEGNTIFNNGSIGWTETKKKYGIFKRNILVGGYFVAESPVILNNYTYFPGSSGESLNLGYRAGSKDAIVENNYFAGGRVALGGQNTGIAMLQNTILGFSLPDLSLAQNEFVLVKPADAKIFVRPNQYEPGRANVTIYNWAKTPTVTLTAEDLKEVGIQKGDQYELRNVQDYFSDILTGTYDGEKIEVPMTAHTVAQPLGLNFKPPSTFPEFGAFVLLVTSNQQAVVP